MIMHHDKLISATADSSLEIHCAEVTIYQKCDGGLFFTGHGAFRIHSSGMIYLEFICTESNPIKPHIFQGGAKTFRTNSSDKNETMYLEAISLAGDRIFAYEFNFRLNLFNRTPPFKIQVNLREVFIEDEEHQEVTASYLYMEMHDIALIPPNKTNTEQNSYGESSSSWNESSFEVGCATVKILNRDDRISVTVKGEFDVSEIYDPIIFYLGFTSGILPQPYCVVTRVLGHTKLCLKSINGIFRHKNMPQPVHHIVQAPGFPESHYDLLREMYRLNRSIPIRFESASNHWYRVWHAFQSEENVLLLTLGVAVEGILNDVFIPALKISAVDDEFEKTKVDIINELKNLSLEREHIKVLQSAVQGWGNINPKKALDKLVELKIVEKHETAAWRKLRNAAAHPVYGVVDLKKQAERKERLGLTLTLFYRLIFNIFRYSGPAIDYKGDRTSPHVLRTHVPVLVEPAVE